MKKTRFIFPLLALMLLLAGCGETPGEPATETSLEIQPVVTEDIPEAINTLLTRDYIASYQWYCDGLATDGQKTTDDYYLVKGETLTGLRSLVENTYTAELAHALMNATDEQGRERFTEREGNLYKSCYPVLSRYLWDYDAESVTILSQEEDAVQFQFTMTNLLSSEDGRQSVTMEMVREDGAWKLTQVSFAVAEGEAAMDSPESIRELADRFLLALTENDTAAIAECAGEAEGTYSDWVGMTITEAKLTDTLESYDGYGRFRVKMQVKNAFGVFGKGSEDYILVATVDSDGTPAVCYFEPENKIAYNYAETRDDAACNMTDVFLNYEGYQKFKGSFWMDDETATDFAMAMLTYQNPSQTVFTQEEVTAAAKRFLAYTDFKPSEEEKFITQEGYVLPGRSMTLGHYLLWPSYSDGQGHTLVKVEQYSDSLNTKDCVSYLFTYKTNADGSLCLLSIT